MTRTRKMWIGLAAGVMLVLAGAGAVWAQTPTPGTSGKTFLDRVAEKLGIDTPKLQQAIKDAGGDDLNERVANGDLTQKQADRLQQGLDERVDNGGFGLGRGPGMHGQKGFAFGFGLGLRDGAQKLADFLGISLDQLKTELSADGATLATVAQAHGKSRDELKGFITSEAQTKLDQAVSNQNLTQKQADQILSMLNEHVDKLIDGAMGGPLRFRKHFEWRGGPQAPNGGDATPQAGSSIQSFDRG